MLLEEKLSILTPYHKIFAYSENKLTCHFVVVVLVLLVVGGKRSKRSEKGQKRLLPVDQR